MKALQRIDSFDLQIGRVLANKYEIVESLGKGWEGEVYKIREINTGIERAAKLFYPQRNIKNKSTLTYAKKLHKLAECPVLIQYHSQETIRFKNMPITILISEYVEGDLLWHYLKRFPAMRMPGFQAIHLLHALACGLECVHHAGEYHGDLHTENIIISRLGLTYELKLIDLFHYGRATKANRQEDICMLIRVFYDVIGGQKYYHKQPQEIRDIICGQKRSLILKKFPTISDLKIHLETCSWN